ncbi:hypothetical protein BDBG_06851 [Blastomyces gilchristii SLH14081]|uniref:Uncharacterized protein n=1 Tax=Blastomyces gilchristii (strain SLH14081) TaxID=559298 RepID=A0A179UU61_BLAGS|nr:uncharacterized protein BDBG_06851 [Blastomyces gilchristii SLH14081]OAT11343.1 hypothetical protein BDBG_06851 [Blastomyces gilchristii SLH14081]
MNPSMGALGMPRPSMDSPRQHQQWHHSLRRTPLERLPIELIQKIFFECLEINLPRASLPIALALSNDVIHTWLIRLAFSSNNESARTGFFTKPYLPLDYFSLSASQRASLQTEILKCRWCTLPLMRKCQREHVEHVIREKCKYLRISCADCQKLENLKPYWESMDRFDPRPPGSRGSGDLTVEARISQPPNIQPENNPSTSTFIPITPTPAPNTTNMSIILGASAASTHSASRKIAIWFNSGSVQIRERSPIFQETDVFRLPSCSTREPCRIPDRLLCPPWTPEKLEFLTLLSTEAYIDENERRDRSKAVLRQVIDDRDLETFKYMLGMHIRAKNYGYPFPWPVRQTHYRAAARMADRKDDDPFLRILFTDRKGEVPATDQSIKALLVKYEQREREREIFES